MNEGTIGFLFEGASFRERLIGWSIIGVPLVSLVLLAAIFLGLEPINKQVVVGCYLARGAPPLNIKLDSIEIADNSGRSFKYDAEPYKNGYHLVVSPALILEPRGNGKYAFAPRRGIGYFWPLLTQRSNNPRHMGKPTDFGGRIDVNGVIYLRSFSPEPCGSGIK